MTDRLTIIPQPIAPAGQARQKPVVHKGQVGQFDQLLDQAQKKSQVKFSGHALGRMQTRGISFNQDQLDRLQQAVTQIDAKGGRDSLVMLDDSALVVSVKNETVGAVAGCRPTEAPPQEGVQHGSFQFFVQWCQWS